MKIGPSNETRGIRGNLRFWFRQLYNEQRRVHCYRLTNVERSRVWVSKTPVTCQGYRDPANLEEGWRDTISSLGIQESAVCECYLVFLWSISQPNFIISLETGTSDVKPAFTKHGVEQGEGSYSTLHRVKKCTKMLTHHDIICYYDDMIVSAYTYW